MKAIVLLSGGLDSTLAARIAKDLGIEPVAFNTISPFCVCNHRSSGGCYHGAAAAAKDLGIRFISLDVSQEFLDIVKAPKHGYGSNMNPCIDCRILLFRKAAELMRREGISFVITGEVVGQRPMSQKRDTLRLIEREAGLEGLVVRPLSAKLLAPTIPENKGWISRERLLSIEGRSRRAQIALAREFGINDYPCPAGGCLLTDPIFSRKVRDLIVHDQFDLPDVKLLKHGRHFRLNRSSKLIVGRDEKENGRIRDFAREGDCLFEPRDIAGPAALGRGALFDRELMELSCSVVAHYCDTKAAEGADIRCIRVGSDEAFTLAAAALSQDALADLSI